MFDELNKYTLSDHFFFKPTDSLSEVCNAPADKDGVYLVYALKHGRIELMYIGSSEKLADEKIKTEISVNGGIKELIVNGKHFGGTPRKRSWPIQMLSEDIEALDIYWWATWNGKHKDRPADVEALILNNYYSLYGRLPKWNKTLPKLK